MALTTFYCLCGREFEALKALKRHWIVKHDDLSWEEVAGIFDKRGLVSPFSDEEFAVVVWEIFATVTSSEEVCSVCGVEVDGKEWVCPACREKDDRVAALEYAIEGVKA